MASPTLTEVNGRVRFSNSRHRWTERRSLIVEVRDGDRVGRGEAAPLPGYSKETLAECRSALEEGGHLPAAAEFALAAANAELRGEAALDPGPALALATLSTDAPAAAWKCKIGRDLKAELALAKTQRHRPIRFDANGTLGAGGEDVRCILASLAELTPEFVEEPVPFDELEALYPSPVPIALDESLHGDDGCERLRHALKKRWAHVLVVKPMALGPTRARKLCAIAREFGAPCIVSHLFGGPLAFATTAHFAFEHATRHAQGLGRHIGLEAFAGYSTELGSGGMIERWEGNRWPVQSPET